MYICIYVCICACTCFNVQLCLNLRCTSWICFVCTLSLDVLLRVSKAEHSKHKGLYRITASNAILKSACVSLHEVPYALMVYRIWYHNVGEHLGPYVGGFHTSSQDGSLVMNLYVNLKCPYSTRTSRTSETLQNREEPRWPTTPTAFPAHDFRPLISYLQIRPPYELLSKLLVSPLIRPIIVHYIIPCITAFKEFRL